MIVLLPFFRPPREPLDVGRGSLKDFPAETEGAFPVSLYGFESWKILGGKNGLRGRKKLTEFRWAGIEMHDNVIPAVCIGSACDLITGHWKYVLKRTQFVISDRLKPEMHSFHVPRYSFSPTFVRKLSQALDFLYQNRRARVAFERWSSGYLRSDPIDTVLDCCSSLEAALNLPDELRLRMAMTAYHSLKRNKKRVFAMAYKMYNLRNKFIHGNEIPEISPSDQSDFVWAVGLLLSEFLKVGKLPDQKIINELIMRQCGTGLSPRT